MHESRLVADLADRAELQAMGRPAAITTVRLRIGALSAVRAAALRYGMAQQARQRWGHEPAIEIEEADDPTDPTALGVVLVSIGLTADAADARTEGV